MIKSKGKTFCCFGHHDKDNKGTPLGKSDITVEGDQKSVLDLLGSKGNGPATDHEVQDRMKNHHSFSFNMGAGKYFDKFEDAEDELLKRNFPTISDDCQDCAIFVPETFLPKVPRAVDQKKYETTKKSLSEQFKNILRMKSGSEENQNLLGDLVEKELSDALKDFYSQNKDDREVTVFQGAVFIPPGTKKGGNQEHDFLIVSKILKCIICIESKKSLNGKSVTGGLKQLEGMEKLIEEYFGPMSGWSYVAWMHFQVNNSDLHICEDCKNNIIFKKEDLHTKLSELYNANKATPNHDEYMTVVKRIAFTLLSQDIGTPCTITSMVDNKVVGKGGKQGQGDFESYLFWTLNQANLMLVEYPFVIFTSPWSTGKTLCMREQAKKRAKENSKQNINFIVCSWFTKKTTLLEMELRQEFSNFSNIKFKNIPLNSDPTTLGSPLLSWAQSDPGAAFFIDEAALPADDQKLSSLSEQLSKVVTILTNGKGMLWMTVAGYYGNINPTVPTMSTMETTFPMFHLPVMNIPLRSTREVLVMAGVEGETSSIKYIAGSLKTSPPIYTIPPLLLPGLPGITERVLDRKNKEEVVKAVKSAREKMTGKTRAKGVPVLCTGHTKDLFSFVREGLLMATIQGGTLNNAERVITYTSADEGVGEEVVSSWLDKHNKSWLADKDEEERDLLTDQLNSKGWEAPAIMIVDLWDSKFYGVENVIMRGRTFVALVTNKKDQL